VVRLGWCGILMQAEALVLWFGWGGVVSFCRLKPYCCGSAGVVWYPYAG